MIRSTCTCFLFLILSDMIGCYLYHKTSYLLFVLYSLVRPANLDELVNYVLQPPAEEENEKIKYKLVSVAPGAVSSLL